MLALGLGVLAIVSSGREERALAVGLALSLASEHACKEQLAQSDACPNGPNTGVREDSVVRRLVWQGRCD